MARIIVGWILFAGFIAAAIGATFRTFIDVPSLFLVLGGTVALLLVNFSVSEIIRIVAQTVRFAPLSGKHRHEAILFWQAMTRAALCTGTIGTLLGLVLMLQNLSDPNSIGPAMAVAFLTTIYGIFVAGAVSMPGEMIALQIAETAEE